MPETRSVVPAAPQHPRAPQAPQPLRPLPLPRPLPLGLEWPSRRTLPLSKAGPRVELGPRRMRVLPDLRLARACWDPREELWVDVSVQTGLVLAP